MKKLLFILLIGLCAGTNAADNFAKDKLVAWCVVPFDAKQRGPAERAAMLKQLGLKRVAYDWRTQHVKEFEEEILQYKNTVWNFLPFGKGMRRHFDCSKNIKSIRRFGVPYVALKPIVRRPGWRLRRKQCCPWFSGLRNWAANSGSTTMEGGVVNRPIWSRCANICTSITTPNTLALSTIYTTAMGTLPPGKSHYAK